MNFKLGFLTVGILRAPVGQETVQGFVDRIPAVYVAADRSDGFHARSIRDLGTWLHSWGEVQLPSCFPTPPSEEHIAMTLSLWRDLESVAAFAYHGPHAEALSRRREWFEQHKVPPYVAWWVPEHQAIDWKQAKEKLEKLHAEGPTSSAFTFGRPFGPHGNACALDREAVKAKAARNAQA